jgi:hypothetical protein
LNKIDKLKIGPKLKKFNENLEAGKKKRIESEVIITMKKRIKYDGKRIIVDERRSTTSLVRNRYSKSMRNVYKYPKHLKS